MPMVTYAEMGHGGRGLPARVVLPLAGVVDAMPSTLRPEIET